MTVTREIRYETLIEQAKGLAVQDQLRLISDLSANLRQELLSASPNRKTSADFYGALRGVQYDESDFVAAEWQPLDGEPGGN